MSNNNGEPEFTLRLTPDTETEEGRWLKLSAAGKKVPPLKRPCKDCGITTGFYEEYAGILKKQPEDVQQKVIDTWFCHNNCKRGCAGIRDFVNSQPNSHAK